MAGESPERIDESAKPENLGYLLLPEAESGLIGPIYEREDLVNRCLKLFENRRNILLVGEPGTGKSACVEAIACRMAKGEIPADFPFKDIVETNYSRILEGCFYSGNIENKISSIFKNCSQSDVILFIDNIHFALSPLGNDPEYNLYNLLVDRLPKNGEAVIIATTTPEAFQLLQTSNPSGTAKFEKIEVEPTSWEETLSILETLKGEFESKYRVQLISGLFEEILELSDRFYPWRKFPGKAFEILTSLIRGKQAEIPLSEETITPEDVQNFIIEETGLNPIIVKRPYALPKSELLESFNGLIFGQESAVEEVVNTILRFKEGTSNPRKPAAALLFSGPTGVGKTELAKVLANFLFGSQEKLLNYSMSLYRGPDGVAKLVEGYRKNVWENGRLIKDVRSSPFCVILLDEIDQASPEIRYALYQILDEGRLVDCTGQTAYFSSAILIATTNVGASSFFPQVLGFEQPEAATDPNQEMEKDANTALTNEFGPPFLNRFTKIVFFKPLGRDIIKKITEKCIRSIAERPGFKRRNISLEINSSLMEILLEKGYERRYGARPMERAIEYYVVDPATAFLSENPDVRDVALICSFQSGQVKVRI